MSSMKALNRLHYASMKFDQKQRTIKMLVIYMITALLFLTSVELHIHTHETAATVDHGFAVSISSLSDSFSTDTDSDEIIVSQDSVIKIKQDTVNLLAVFLLIAILLSVLCRTFIGRIREKQTLLPYIPFHGTPPLRAPPL